MTQRRAIRDRVDGLDAPTPQALGHYTAGNAAILAAIKTIGSISTDTMIVIKVIGLEAFLTAKEFAGIERAIGSGGFASGHFDADRILFLQDLISPQATALQRFLILSSTSRKEAFARIQAMPEIEAIMAMRDIAKACLTTADLNGVTAKQFFSATTARINAFKALEDDLVAEVRDFATSQFYASLSMSAALAAGMFSVLLFSVLVTRFSVRNMLVAVCKISNAGDRLANGDNDLEMPS